MGDDAASVESVSNSDFDFCPAPKMFVKNKSSMTNDDLTGLSNECFRPIDPRVIFFEFLICKIGFGVKFQKILASALRRVCDLCDSRRYAAEN